jgi:toxin ParE1/3/4
LKAFIATHRNPVVEYSLTLAAQEDLREIARYTLKQWGPAQSLRYAGLLEQCFVQIAAGSRLSRSVSERYPVLQVCRCEHHYVFYVHPQDRKPQIIAVLHEKMDLLQRLKGRLA